MTPQKVRWMAEDSADDAPECPLPPMSRAERWSMRPGGTPLGGGEANATTLTLRAVPESVKEARDFTRLTLHGWGMDAMYEDMGLVVSELVTNAVRHGGHGDGEAPIRLSLLRTGSHVMCAIADAGDDVPVRKEPDHIGQTGRGLHLVEAFSQSWSWTPLCGRGKVVWAMFLVSAVG